MPVVQVGQARAFGGAAASGGAAVVPAAAAAAADAPAAAAAIAVTPPSAPVRFLVESGRVVFGPLAQAVEGALQPSNAVDTPYQKAAPLQGGTILQRNLHYHAAATPGEWLATRVFSGGPTDQQYTEWCWSSRACTAIVCHAQYAGERSELLRRALAVGSSLQNAHADQCVQYVNRYDWGHHHTMPLPVQSIMARGRPRISEAVTAWGAGVVSNFCVVDAAAALPLLKQRLSQVPQQDPNWSHDNLPPDVIETLVRTAPVATDAEATSSSAAAATSSSLLPSGVLLALAGREYEVGWLIYDKADASDGVEPRLIALVYDLYTGLGNGAPLRLEDQEASAPGLAQAVEDYLVQKRAEHAELQRKREEALQQQRAVMEEQRRLAEAAIERGEARPSTEAQQQSGFGSGFGFGGASTAPSGNSGFGGLSVFGANRSGSGGGFGFGGGGFGGGFGGAGGAQRDPIQEANQFYEAFLERIKPQLEAGQDLSAEIESQRRQRDFAVQKEQRKRDLNALLRARVPSPDAALSEEQKVALREKYTPKPVFGMQSKPAAAALPLVTDEATLRSIVGEIVSGRLLGEHDHLLHRKSEFAIGWMEGLDRIRNKMADEIKAERQARADEIIQRYYTEVDAGRKMQAENAPAIAQMDKEDAERAATEEAAEKAGTQLPYDSDVYRRRLAREELHQDALLAALLHFRAGASTEQLVQRMLDTGLDTRTLDDTAHFYSEEHPDLMQARNALAEQHRHVALAYGRQYNL